MMDYSENVATHLSASFNLYLSAKFNVSSINACIYMYTRIAR